MPIERWKKKLFKQELNPVNLQALRLAVLPWHNLTVACFSGLLLEPEEVLSGVELGSLLNILLNRLMKNLTKNSLLKSPFERDWFGMSQFFFFLSNRMQKFSMLCLDTKLELFEFSLDFRD